MATAGAMGKRRVNAVARIEQRCGQLADGASLRLPTFSHYGADMLLILQLETIADFLESISLPAASATPSQSQTPQEKRPAKKGAA